MRRNERIAYLIVVIIGLLFGLYVNSYNRSLTVVSASAQDTAAAWEYGGLIYEGESAFVFTDDLAVNNELNKVLEGMGSDINLITALNVMGAAGWEYSATLRQGEGQTLYLFKRPG